MGLGKTPEALLFANILGLSRVLVVSTANARLNWAREADTWFTLSRKNSYATAILSSKDLQYVQKKSMFKKDYLPSPFIVSYDMLVSSAPLRKYIEKRTWDLGIFDEFHECKSMTAQRTHACMFLWKHIEYTLLLSGTPLTNSAADLFPALNAITQQPHMKKYFTQEERTVCETFDNFVQKFTYIRNSPYSPNPIYSGIRNKPLLKGILRHKEANFFFRTLKKNVLKDLPDKTYNRVDLNLNLTTTLDPEFCERFLKALKNNDQAKITRMANSPQMGTMRRELGEAIITCKDAHDFTKQFLDYGKPVVVFAWHKSVISFLTNHFKRHNPVVHDGSKTPKQKQQAVDDFQNGHTNLFIGNIKSAGIAITLTRASDCIFYEIDWLPHIVAQAIDRLHRIGQKNAVTAHFFLLLKNEFHKRFMQTMIRKQRAIDGVI